MKALVRRQWAVYWPRVEIPWLSFLEKWRNANVNLWSYPQLYRREHPDKRSPARDEWEIKIPIPPYRQW